MKQEDRIKEETTRLNVKDLCKEIAQKMDEFDRRRARPKTECSTG
ncbi:MAG: hypothetical protein R3224_06840 [Balneolaceae bacterium]|nr:hypothetical protein [Balneolaceae bacterium]